MIFAALSLLFLWTGMQGITASENRASLSKEYVSLVRYVGTTDLSLVGMEGQEVVWESSDARVVTVVDGKLQAKQEGSAKVTAKADGRTFTCYVSVYMPYPQPKTGIVYNSRDGKPMTGWSAVLPEDDHSHDTGTLEGAETVTIKWRVQNQDSGEVLMYVEGKNGAGYVSHHDLIDHPCTYYADMPVGDSNYISIYQNISGSTVLFQGKNWRTKDASIATVEKAVYNGVENQGRVTGKKAGITTITAEKEEESYSKSITDSTYVTVYKPLASMGAYADEESVLYAGAASYCTPSTILKKGTKFIINGEVGDYYRILYGKNTYYILKKNVSIPAVSLSIPKRIQMIKNTRQVIVPQYKPSLTTDKLKWKSSNANIAEVDEKGRIKAKRGGRATITATIGNLSADCIIDVTAYAETVTLPRYFILPVKSTKKITAGVSPSDTTDHTVKWTSSNTKLFTTKSDKGSKTKAVIRVGNKEGVASVRGTAKDRGIMKAESLVSVYSKLSVKGVRTKKGAVLYQAAASNKLKDLKQSLKEDSLLQVIGQSGKYDYVKTVQGKTGFVLKSKTVDLLKTETVKRGETKAIEIDTKNPLLKGLNYKNIYLKEIKNSKGKVIKREMTGRKTGTVTIKAEIGQIKIPVARIVIVKDLPSRTLTLKKGIKGYSWIGKNKVKGANLKKYSSYEVIGTYGNWYGLKTKKSIQYINSTGKADGITLSPGHGNVILYDARKPIVLVTKDGKNITKVSSGGNTIKNGYTFTTKDIQISGNHKNVGIDRNGYVTGLSEGFYEIRINLKKKVNSKKNLTHKAVYHITVYEDMEPVTGYMKKRTTLNVCGDERYKGLAYPDAKKCLHGLLEQGDKVTVVGKAGKGLLRVKVKNQQNKSEVYGYVEEKAVSYMTVSQLKINRDKKTTGTVKIVFHNMELKKAKKPKITISGKSTIGKGTFSYKGNKVAGYTLHVKGRKTGYTKLTVETQPDTTGGKTKYKYKATGGISVHSNYRDDNGNTYAGLSNEYTLLKAGASAKSASRQVVQPWEKMQILAKTSNGYFFVKMDKNGATGYLKEKEVVYITLSGNVKILQKGKRTSMEAAVHNANGSVRWNAAGGASSITGGNLKGNKEGKTIITASYRGITSPYCKVFVWSKTKKDDEGYTNQKTIKKGNPDAIALAAKKHTGLKIVGTYGKYYYVQEGSQYYFVPKRHVTYLTLNKIPQIYRYHNYDAKAVVHHEKGVKLRWKVSNKNGTINKKGKLWAEKPGTVTVTVSTRYGKGKEIKASRKVKIKNIQLVVLPQNSTVQLGGFHGLISIVETIPNAKVTWSVENSSVAVIRELKGEGLPSGMPLVQIQTKKVGLTKITARYRDLTAVHFLQVTPMPPLPKEPEEIEKAWYEKAFDWIGGVANGAKNVAGKFFGGVGKGFVKFYTGIVDGIGGFIDNPFGAIKNMGKQILAGALPFNKPLFQFGIQIWNKNWSGAGEVWGTQLGLASLVLIMSGTSKGVNKIKGKTGGKGAGRKGTSGGKGRLNPKKDPKPKSVAKGSPKSKSVPKGGSKGGTVKVDPNKLKHIFGKAEHKLQDFLKSYKGNQTNAFNAIEKAIQKYVTKNGITGTFKDVVIKVKGYNITVRGAVIDGKVKIGTAFIP